MKRPGSRSRHNNPASERDVDEHFFDRADAMIHLANEQLARVNPGKVSASTLYASARFNAWVTALGSTSAEEMASARTETIEYFVAQYLAMLEENLDDYIANFDQYMRPTN
jgi:hypothetical protein